MARFASEPADDHVVGDRLSGGGLSFEGAFDHADHDLVVPALRVDGALTGLVEAVVAVAVTGAEQGVAGFAECLVEEAAVISVEQLESSMRSFSASGENPPNTTECTAPMRAHASMATAASGIMGM